MKSIIIATQQTRHNEWLAFASWYSIHRNAPDMQVGVIFPRNGKTFQYNWLRRCGVPFAYSEEANTRLLWANGPAMQLGLEGSLVIPDTVMMIRSDSQGETWVEATSEEPAALVDVSKVGKFNLAEWVEKEKSHPFHRTAQFLGRERTVNEQRVVALWRQMGQSFDFINRP